VRACARVLAISQAYSQSRDERSRRDLALSALFWYFRDTTRDSGLNRLLLFLFRRTIARTTSQQIGATIRSRPRPRPKGAGTLRRQRTPASSLRWAARIRPATLEVLPVAWLALFYPTAAVVARRPSPGVSIDD
jgi:hypothetical protein